MAKRAAQTLLVFCALTALSLSSYALSVFANNLTIANVTLETRDRTAHTFVVEFDVSWNNAWRNRINHSAVWLFVKADGSPAHQYQLYHAVLSASGTTPTGFSAGSDTNLEIRIPSDKMGAFLRPSSYLAPGTSISTTNVRLVIDYTDFHEYNDCSPYASAMSDTEEITDLRVYGVEMVYIPQGAFYAGDYYTGTAAFQQGWDDSNPWYISSEGAISVTNAESNGYYYTNTGAVNIYEESSGAAFTINAAYPKGYDDFYCMKYELTEGLWVAMVDTFIHSTFCSSRDVTSSTGTDQGKGSDGVVRRNTISQDGCTISTSRPDRAMNYISWMDLAAWLDWAALRPMSELEFEKVARGPLLPLKGEYAWGTTSITCAAADGISPDADEDGDETITTTGANCCCGSADFTTGDGRSGGDAESQDGPLRVGIFAASHTNPTREQSGAGYYGVMDLSGSMWEFVATVGNSAGYTIYEGDHGDGMLAENFGTGTYLGDATHCSVTTWPGVTGENIVPNPVSKADGSGYRGGAWHNNPGLACSISDRRVAAEEDDIRSSILGGRGVRDAP